jgi:hypothetical protein
VITPTAACGVANRLKLFGSARSVATSVFEADCDEEVFEVSEFVQLIAEFAISSAAT